MKTNFSKLLVVTFLLLSISFAASAQIYLGGSIGGAYSKVPSTNSKTWAVNVEPEVGYAFNDKWAVGGRISYGKALSMIESPYLNEKKTEVDLFTFNPYAAFSVFSYKGFSICAEAGLQIAPKQNGVKFTTYGAYITPVLTYSIGKHLILKTDLDFAGIAVTGTSEGGFTFAGTVGGDDAISIDDDLSIGFIFRF